MLVPVNISSSLIDQQTLLVCFADFYKLDLLREELKIPKKFRCFAPILPSKFHQKRLVFIILRFFQ